MAKAGAIPKPAGMFAVIATEWYRASCPSNHRSHLSDPNRSRLHFPEPSAPADRIEAFGKSLVLLIDAKAPENSLLLRKPTLRTSHAGGERIRRGSPEEVALLAWIDRLTQLKGEDLAKALRYLEEESAGNGARRPETVLRRLSHGQYNRTVRDLLGDRSLPANQFPPEDFVNGFKNQNVAQGLSPAARGRVLRQGRISHARLCHR